MTIKGSTLTYTPQDTHPRPESYSIYGWPTKLRARYLEDWQTEHPPLPPGRFSLAEQTQVFAPPEGYSDVVDHLAHFFIAVRTRKPPVENESFGNNAALGCHLSNYAYFNQTTATWDAQARKIRG